MRLLQDAELRIGTRHHVENRKRFMEYMKTLFDHVENLRGEQIINLFDVEGPTGDFSDAVRALEELEESFWVEIDEPLREYLLTTHWEIDVAQLFQKSVLYQQAHFEKDVVQKISINFHTELFRAVDATYRTMTSGGSMKDVESQVTNQVSNLWNEFRALPMEQKVYVSARFLKYKSNPVFDQPTANEFKRIVETKFASCMTLDAPKANPSASR